MDAIVLATDVVEVTTPTVAPTGSLKIARAPKGKATTDEVVETVVADERGEPMGSHAAWRKDS